MTYDTEAVDEATLLNLRYALADAIELCRGISGPHKSDAVVIDQMLHSATLQVMLLLKLQQTSLAAAMDHYRLLTSAA